LPHTEPQRDEEINDHYLVDGLDVKKLMTIVSQRVSM